MNCVGVLKLVDQQKLKALAVVVQDVGAVAQQLVGAQQDLGKVDQARLVAVLFVGLIYAQHLLGVQVAVMIDVLRSQAFVLAAVDKPLHLTWRPLGLVQFQVFQDAADQSVLVVRVEDLKGLRQFCILPVGAQETMRQRVEGADPHAADRLTKQVFDAVTHLGRSLVGEGHRHDVVGRRILGRQQPGDAMHQDAGLAAAGAGQDQLLSPRGGHGLALGVIEGVDYVSNIHGAGL